MLKRFGKPVIESAAFDHVVTWLERLDKHGQHSLRVLTYHRVDYPERTPQLYPGLISATPDMFRKQMAYLAGKYHVVSMEAVLAACRGQAMLPPQAVLITFDDAYNDFARYAWPILQQYQLPATLFVPTAYPDCPERAFWWDRLYRALQNAAMHTRLDTPTGYFTLTNFAQRYQTFKRLRNYVKTLPHSQAMPFVDDICRQSGMLAGAHAVLGWDELRQLARAGVTLCPHTQTHPLLSRTPLDTVRIELSGSRQDLEREIGTTLPVFAYPGGDFNDQVVTILQEEGFEVAFVTRPGINDLQANDHLRLRRINVSRHTNLALLRMRLLSLASAAA